MPGLKRTRDYDPEDSPAYSSASSAAGNSEDESGPETADTNGIGGREHYEPVSKSKLRQRETAALGPQYAGSRVNREDAGSEDEQGHDPFSGFDGEESSEDDDDADGMDGIDSSIDGNIGTGADDEDENTDATSLSEDEHMNDDQASDLDESDISDNDEDIDAPPRGPKRSTTSNPPETDRAQLRNLMNRTNTSITSSLHSANQADAEKGRAVKRQRQTYDQLLNSRIQLQQGLLAANALPMRKEEQGEREAVYRGAEEAALGLWNTLNGLRQRIASSSSSNAADTKPEPFTATTSTPLTDLWAQMQQHENLAAPHRKSTLRKWSQKTAALASTTQTTSKNRLTGGNTTQPTVLDILETQHLAPSNIERLVERARTPKQAAPGADASEGTVNGHDTRGFQYDDSDFYASLLRDLIASRNSSDDTPSAPVATKTPAETTEATLRAAQKAARTRRWNVDVKASKGRKMKYTVHEKLQNFMAPEDRGGWGQRQREELFGSLLGQMRRSTVSGVDDEDAVDGINDEDLGMDRQEEALRLFRA